MKFTNQSRSCHPERSEGSLCPSSQTLRFAQGDTGQSRSCHPERSEGSLCPSSRPFASLRVTLVGNLSERLWGKPHPIMLSESARGAAENGHAACKAHHNID